MGIERAQHAVHEARRLGKLFTSAAKIGFLDKECTPDDWSDKIERARNHGGAGNSLYVALVFSIASDICSRFKVLDDNFFKQRHAIDISLLPFDFEKRFSLSKKIGEGYFRRAYLVTPRAGSSSRTEHVNPFVVTWSYKIISENSDTLERYAAAVERNRSYLQKIYSAIPTALITETSRIFPIRRDGGDVLVSVAEYVDGDLTNFLEDEHLFELLADSQQRDFRNVVETFVHSTLRAYAEEGMIIDFRGEHNVVVQRKNGRAYLKILDVNMLYSENEVPTRRGDISLGSGERPLVLGIITPSVRASLQEQIVKLKAIGVWLKMHPAN